ncbi:MAG: hypothetical protein ACI83W_000376 [Marinoscillum sp.]|jgi:hypothetical protein
MKALNKLTRITGLLIILMVTLPALGQEYDDLYFSSKDRKKSEEPKVTESLNVYQAYTANNYTDEYSANKVNPEYIARYQASKEYSSDSEFAVSDDNANYSQPSYSNISYYPEEQQYANYENQNAPTVINNYYGNSGMNNGWNNNGWNNNNWNDPFFDPWMNTSMMWSPFYNRNRFSIGFGFGGYDPWNSWAFGGNYYSGFWGNPVGGFGYGSPWNGYGYNAGFNNGQYYGGWSEGVSSSPSRDVVVGSRYSRGGSVVQGSRSGNSRTPVPNGGSRANLANNDTRDYSRTQNEYYARSRSGVASNSGTSSRDAVASTRSRSNTDNNGANVNPGRPSTNSNYGRGNSGSQVSSSNTANRRYSTSTTPSSGSRSNSSYSSGSTNRSRSSSSYSSGSSSTPSRSSYTPSSSSSGSSSRSSSSFSTGGGSSRSSSGGSSSGGSRSSGGGSSSSRSRGGN